MKTSIHVLPLLGGFLIIAAANGHVDMAEAQAPNKVTCDRKAPKEVWVSTLDHYQATEGMGHVQERGLLRRRKVRLKNGCVLDDKEILGGDTIVAFSAAGTMPFDATMQCVGNKSGEELGFATSQLRDLDGGLWLLRCGNDAGEKTAECVKGLGEGKRQTAYRDRLAGKKTEAHAIQIHSASELAEYGDKLPTADTGVFCQVYSPKSGAVHLAFSYRFDEAAQARRSHKAAGAMGGAFKPPAKVACAATARKLEAWRARRGAYGVRQGIAKVKLTGYLDRNQLKVGKGCVIEEPLTIGQELVLVTGKPKGVTWWGTDEYDLQCVDTASGEALAGMRWPSEVDPSEWVLNCKHDAKEKGLPCTSDKDEGQRKLAVGDKYRADKKVIAGIYFEPRPLSAFLGRDAYCHMRNKATGEVDFAFGFSYPASKP